MPSHDALVDYALASAPPVLSPMDQADLYRRLVRGNLSQVIQNALPVTRSILGDEAFDLVVDQFLDAGGPSTPLYRDVPAEFAAWALDVGHDLADLMGYEWLELVAARHPADLDAMVVEPRAPGDDTVRPNPTMQVGVYWRSVHAMGPDEPDPATFDVPQAYLVWRRPVTDEVCFHRAGLVLAQALAQSLLEPCSVETMTARTAATLKGVNTGALTESLTQLVRGLRRRDGVL